MGSVSRTFLAALGIGLAVPSAHAAEQLIWGVSLEQMEYRFSNDDNADVIAWDGDAMVGTDELKLVLKNEGELERRTDTLETMETQLRLQVPISTFFDAVGGVRLDTPKGRDRAHAVVGVHGLAPQWFEVDLDLFLSNHSSLRLDAEYEALITNYLILTPSIELDVPMSDDSARHVGAWGPKLEVGARLSYDLIDRAVAPYVGIHYERYFGRTENLRVSDGEEGDGLYTVVGVKMLF